MSQHTNANIQLVGGFIGYIWRLANMWVEACYKWSWANQGISLVDLIHLGAYELIELENMHMLLAMRWLNRLND